MPGKAVNICIMLYRPAMGIDTKDYLKSLNAKTDTSIFINLRYLRLELMKNKGDNKKICDILIITSKIFLVI